MAGLLKGYESTLTLSKEKTLDKLTKEDGQVVPHYNFKLLSEMQGQAYSRIRMSSSRIINRGAGRDAGLKAGLNLTLAKGVTTNKNRCLQISLKKHLQID